MLPELHVYKCIEAAGTWTKQDISAAVHILTIAASKGHGGAQFLLGMHVHVMFVVTRPLSLLLALRCSLLVS